MSESVLVVSDVSKQLSGRTVLSDINLTLAPGEVCGLVGPNGAGKTTLLRLIAGLAWPSTGSISILGRTPGRDRLISDDNKALVTAVPEFPAFIPEFSGYVNLKLLASITRRPDKREITRALSEAGLDPEDRRRVSQYSLGMKQRLGIAQAVMESPRLMLLDEPTNGLDPLGIRELGTTLDRLAARGTTILMASHLLSVVERTCTRVVIIAGGRLIHELEPGQDARAVRIVVSSDTDWKRVEEWAGQRSVIRDGNNPSGLILGDPDVPEIIASLSGAGISIEAIHPQTSSVEDQLYESLRRERR